MLKFVPPCYEGSCDILAPINVFNAIIHIHERIIFESYLLPKTNLKNPNLAIL